MTEDLPPFPSEALGTINTHIDRIARIVRNLGDFARLNPRQKVLTQLKDILEVTMSLVRYDKNFKKINIKTDFQEVPLVKVDPDQMQQVFLNLMLNARDAMPEGGELYISVKHRNGYAETVFADTGSGIDRDSREKLFDPFFTTKGPKKGTGLGLSICYSIIKDHGGRIEVESAMGRGTQFAIRLPLKYGNES